MVQQDRYRAKAPVGDADDEMLATCDTRNEQNRTFRLGRATDRYENISRDHRGHALSARLGCAIRRSGASRA